LFAEPAGAEFASAEEKVSVIKDKANKVIVREPGRKSDFNIVPCLGRAVDRNSSVVGIIHESR
jgi:hypothetical protein